MHDMNLLHSRMCVYMHLFSEPQQMPTTCQRKIPAENPKLVSSNFRFASVKNTMADPAAVTPHVNNVPKTACHTGEYPSIMVPKTHNVTRLQRYYYTDSYFTKAKTILQVIPSKILVPLAESSNCREWCKNKLKQQLILEQFEVVMTLRRFDEFCNAGSDTGVR